MVRATTLWDPDGSGPMQPVWVVAGQYSVAGPNTVALAGQLLHQQVVPIEADAVGNLVALTSTNGLTVTIGAF